MDHSGMNHGASEMSGMMTSEQMGQLGEAGGAAFDRMFLEMMVVHHEGAITDSERELAEGVNPEAKALASEIIIVQTEEIELMRQLLQGL